MVYQKFVYWLEETDFRALETGPGKIDPPPSIETHIPCRVLRTSLKAGVVPPSAWSEGFCRRRTSWYMGCGKTGKYLVVSRDRLDSLPVQDEMVVEDSVFKPGKLPLSDDISALARSASFKRRKPAQWDQVEEPERDVYRRWHERFGGGGPFDFERLFLFHSANHANFLEPRFFMESDQGKVPYSIADSLHTCSSCLEFFNILGGEWPVKYVVPCLGAVQFARLPRDQFFKVTTGVKTAIG
jgi:hypothetical protein